MTTSGGYDDTRNPQAKRRCPDCRRVGGLKIPAPGWLWCMWCGYREMP